MAFFIKLTLGLLGLYAALIALFALMQGAVLFPRSLVGPAPALPQGTDRISLTRPDGSVLHGSVIAGQDPSKPLILAFGGNAWNADAVALFLHRIAPEHTIAAFHFRGYAPSTGRPSAQALKDDAVAIHDRVAAQGPNGVIVVGFSIGSGLAAHLSAKRPIAGAILVTPFDSLLAVAQQSLPWAPVRFLFRHEMNALVALNASDAPIALVLATQDEVIPPARAEALVDGLSTATRPVAHITRIPAGHNDIYNHPDFAPAMRDALAALGG
ncbi:hypothetical protein LY56_00978 [Roseinatronobacter thiooxidans]|uniref:AB hydrolase-1 domain-containing protein n=1 Tax=Roseinatronobacter thiooxidans TaxID=121821 RepID=A0A2W7QYD9_9RHOB|nr:alpha/beta fold hydrolase [Roseinatronobacter thiooxidans]PZX46769.1 hypothetical protein LY56_00978 [Roseinatronobacter thiooxidans]